MRFQKITLLGVGLLGGSLGLAIKRDRLAGRVSGFVRRVESISECLECGVVDEATCDLAVAARDADLLILCTPLGQMRPIADGLASSLKPGALVTDVGSVKSSVVAELEPIIANSGGFFIGSHPMAGSERTGVRAARADLFNGAACAITPTRQSNSAALRQIEEFWSRIGACPLMLEPQVHDELVSRSSHLPHLIAAGLANYVLDPVHGREQGLLCANGFRDTTRIASGSPEMWRDIVMANRANLAIVLDAFIEELQKLRGSLEKGDQSAINEFFERAKRRRDHWGARPISSSSE